MLTEKPAYERCHFIAKRHPEISADTAFEVTLRQEKKFPEYKGFRGSL
ncbi:Uncharacterized protein dnm_041440 [Desulfonema magnum]|uniref:Uncharacterized protein n=2 Tax=Desulfonema magnum TaxID=45655 RepID=A0A975BMA9_9BACT|nr:Uncharacterized protein dnm_041440 [Desulfonema magnum]